jgi:ribosome-associated protein
LSSEQKAQIAERLSTRITKDGVLQVASQRHRSRESNRRATVERFVALLTEALEEVEPRVRTKVPKAQKKKRLESKRRRSQRKALRVKPDIND